MNLSDIPTPFHTALKSIYDALFFQNSMIVKNVILKLQISLIL